MYLVVAGLSDLEDINSAKHVDINTNKSPSVAFRYANTLTKEDIYDNAFVYELKSNSIKLLLASYS